MQKHLTKHLDENGLLDPKMPAQTMRMHMGEMTAAEMGVARAAIYWANSVAMERHAKLKELYVDLETSAEILADMLKEEQKGNDLILKNMRETLQ